MEHLLISSIFLVLEKKARFLPSIFFEYTSIDALYHLDGFIKIVFTKAEAGRGLYKKTILLRFIARSLYL